MILHIVWIPRNFSINKQMTNTVLHWMFYTVVYIAFWLFFLLKLQQILYIGYFVPALYVHSTDFCALESRINA